MFDCAKKAKLRASIIAKSLPEPNSGCWLWMRGIDRDGYARMHVSSIRKANLAHRVAYEVFREEIAPGTELDHLCRVRCCVNPQHLEAVPHKVNALRGKSFSAINAIKLSVLTAILSLGTILSLGPEEEAGTAANA